MKGDTKSATSLLTTVVKAAPITMPTARSTTLPRSRKARKAFIQGPRKIADLWGGFHAEATTSPQCAQRRASAGITLRHSGQVFVSAGASLRERAISAFA